MFPGFFVLANGMSGWVNAGYFPIVAGGYGGYISQPVAVQDFGNHAWGQPAQVWPVEWGIANEIYKSSSQTNLRGQKSITTPLGTFPLIKRLGNGQFGAVYQTQSSSGQALAIKIDQPSMQFPSHCITSSSPPDYLTIVHEYRMLRMMQGVPGFPRVYGSSFNNPRERMYLMELLGQDLEAVRASKPGGYIPQHELGSLGVQMVNNLERIHKKGYLAVDIHMKNFLLHNGRIFSVDLAWASPIGIPAVPDNCRSPGFGPAQQTGYPRDDLVRLMYTLVYLATGTLPWIKAKKPEEADHLKTGMRSETICGRTGQWLVSAFRFVKGLQATRNVDYEKLRSFLLSR